MKTPTEMLLVKANMIGKDVGQVCEGILEDERFAIWSGSSKPNQHHYGNGGLAQHTLEVVETCFNIKELYTHKYEFDSKELFLAAFFHDVGKMYDYEPEMNLTIHSATNGDSVLATNYSEWKSSPHKRIIHHISRSGIMWSENARKNTEIYDKYFEPVLHAILSHHTCREFGSPVAPKSRVAWLLTLCDNISARMYDADTLDVLDRK